MTEIPDDAREAFERHGTFEAADGEYRVDSTVFEARATATGTDGFKHRYSVTVTVPTLGGAVDGEVGAAVADGWLDTFERRLADAPKATRATVDLADFAVAADGDSETVRVEYAFEFGDPDRAVEIAKTFVEYVEGTYVEGVVPGYDYRPPVSDLLSAATQAGAGDDDAGSRGGTPL